MRVLVVEDQPLIALSLTDTLERSGHEVIGPAADSAGALALAHEHRPRMAFVDIDLESRGVGLHVARRLHSDHIAVVLTTGQPDVARSCECAFGLLSKPYRLEDAAATVLVIEALLDGRVPPVSTIPAALELMKMSEPMSAASHGADASILVIEDEPHDVTLMLEALHDVAPNDAVVIAHNGGEGLDYLRLHSGQQSSRAPSLVLLDVQRLEARGLAILDELKGDSALNSIPVVVMSSSDAEQDIRTSYEHGANAYVVKPLDHEAFLANVRRVGRFWLQRNRAPRSHVTQSIR